MSGGQLNDTCYGLLADYLVAFVKAYEALGVPIWALTPQNEPLRTDMPPGMPGRIIFLGISASLSWLQECTWTPNLRYS